MTFKPYYRDDAVTIYHGDCREIVPTLGRFDLLLTDPPYVFKHMGGGGLGAASPFYAEGALEGMTNFDLSQYRDIMLAPSEMIVAFCSRDQILDYAELARDSGRKFDLHVWFKTNAIPFTGNTWKSDLEYIALLWTKKPGWKQCHQSQHSKAYVSPINQDRSHPACKPVALLAKYLEVLDAKNILDPFAGSGTTGRAAKDMGREAVLIEIEERYCEIAARKMEQEVLSLFQDI